MRKQFVCLSCAAVCLMLFSRSNAAQRPRLSVPAAEVTGAYRMYFNDRFKRESNDIKILALGHGRLRISMDLMYPFMLDRGERSANTGELDGEATIKGDTAVYDSKEFGPCTITIKFVRAETIKVSQEGADADCGFGHNVKSDGIYRKWSSKKPKFGRDQ
ncbi:MAG: hypothetical protein ABJB40_04045 [Acidobacteriota bacterium]